MSASFVSSMQFLSTPSARRATCPPENGRYPAGNFYPRPPRGGRRPHFFYDSNRFHISIHALREEGDQACQQVHELL